MALLTQTADKLGAGNIYTPASVVVAPVFPPTGTAILSINSPILPATVVYAAATDPTVRKNWPLPLTVITPLNVWAVQTNWAIGLNVVLTYGTVILPPAGSKRVSGTFTDQNLAGIARSGYLIDRATGAFLTSFSSDALGHFDGYVPTANPVIALLLPNPGDSRNVVGMDKLVPI